MTAGRVAPRSGIIVVDKPSGMTSHDVVSRVRRIAGTRKVGHAGTLDPMATGVLVIGAERGTKLLGHLMGHDKTYTATIRLGERTTTDDREGATLATASAAHLTAADIDRALAEQVGHIAQIPSSVSAKKIDGRRAYDLVREGKDVELAPREVDIYSIELHDVRTGEYADAEVTVRCSAGTYIRAIARDVGEALGVGGHLVALRRTASGALTESDCVSLDALAELDEPVVHALDDVLARTFPVRQLTEDEATDLSYGRRLAPYGEQDLYAAMAPDGAGVALIGPTGKPSVVFRPA